ncbi:MAG: lytic transglycosylase domain-containing protein [Bdellovibrionota bacterium]
MRGAYAAVKTLAFTALAFALSQSLFADEMLIMGPPQATSAQFDAARTVQFPASYGPFKFDSKIEKRVGFWVNVYVKYHSWETVIHDVKYPWLVYSSIDTTGKPKNAVNIEKARVSALLKRVALKQKQLAAKTLSREKLRADEEKILQLFEANDLVGEIADAAQIKRVRGQAGLRDAMEDALFVSGRYLPRMEKVFERFNLPTEIAYLPFVESGFNKRAMSKVGASGIWQFMPYTGKLYLRVDAEVDERNDPMRAAEAAARLMQNNFIVLGAWPLAITAYNHGTAGMARAAKDVGTLEISEIISKYESKSFGFASQNFYSCFLAALHVAKNSAQFLGEVPRARKLEFDEFVMPDYVDLHVLLAKTEIEETIFRELNPALTEEVYSGRKYIPVGYTIRVPVEARTNFFAQYESMPPEQKFQEQKDIMGPFPASVVTKK